MRVLLDKSGLLIGIALVACAGCARYVMSISEGLEFDLASAAFMVLRGIAVVFIGVAWIWIVVLAFKESFLWGFLSLLLQPIALVYALRREDRCWNPLVLIVLFLPTYILDLGYRVVDWTTRATAGGV